MYNAFRIACLLSLLQTAASTQSLYQDAKALAAVMGQSNTNGENDEPVTFEFREIKPLHYWYLDPSASVLFKPRKGTIELEASSPGDYLLRNLPAHADSLLLYGYGGYGNAGIWGRLPIQYPYYLIRLIPMPGAYLAIQIFSPDNELLLESGLDLREDRVTLRVHYDDYANELKDKNKAIFNDLGEVNSAQHGVFDNNRLALDKLGSYFIFDVLPSQDTLRLLSGKDTVLSLYTLDQSSGQFNYTYVLRTLKEIDTLSGELMVFRNRADQVLLGFLDHLNGEYREIPVYSKPVDNKQVHAVPVLALEPVSRKSEAFYSINPIGQTLSENKDSFQSPSLRMPLRQLVYSFFFEEPRTQILFFRGAELLDSMSFSGQLTFTWTGNTDKLVLKTNKVIAYKPTDLFPAYQSMSFQLDSFRITHVLLNYYSTYSWPGLGCLRYSKYEPETDQFEPYEPAHASDGAFFKQNGLYNIYYDNPDCQLSEDELAEIKSLQFKYQEGENKNEQLFPFHWNPFSGLGPGYNALEFLIDSGKVTFFYVPALEEESRTISLRKKTRLPGLLGTHAGLEAAGLQSPNLWGEISAEYRNNPILGKALQADLAANAFEELPGLSNATLAKTIEQVKKKHYAWQEVVHGQAELQTDNQISYEDVVRTYRTPVNTASDNLQLAAAQFDSESKKLKRGLNTAAIAAGLSDFVVQRAQEELNISFLDRMRDGILNDTTEFLKLFPSTGNMLREFRIIQYRTLLDFAKNAFVLDLRNLGLNFPKLFDLDKYSTIKNDPEVYNIFLLYDIANKVYEGMPVDTVLLHLHRRLQERRAELRKSINLRLADSIWHKPALRDSLVHIIDLYSDQLSECDSRTGFLKNAYDEQRAQLAETLASTTDAALFSRRAATLDSLDCTINLQYREFELVKRNLKGDPDYDYVLQQLPFNRFKEYFAKAPDSTETISAGIAMGEALLHPDNLVTFSKAIDKMEEALHSIKSMRMELAAKQAQKTIDLSDLLPTLEAFKDLQIRRICLDLALETELKGPDRKNLSEHDRQSLVYLQKTLRDPAQYQLFNWQLVDSFSRELMRLRLDSCRIAREDGYPYVTGPTRHLNLLEQQRILAALQELIAAIQPEIENANAFLQKIATTIQAQLQKLAVDQEQKPEKQKEPATQKKQVKQKDQQEQSKQTEEVVQSEQEFQDQARIPTQTFGLFEYFLLTHELSAGTLAFAPEPLLDKMDSLMLGSTAELTDYEIYANGRDSVLESEVQDYLVIISILNEMYQGEGQNPFLLSYDKILRFDQVQDRLLEKLQEQSPLEELKLVREWIVKLQETGARFNAYLDTLKKQEAKDLMASVQQTEEFGTLTEITLQWLYAFKSGSEEPDSIVAYDSIVQRIRIVSVGQDSLPTREISYDTIRVQKRLIAAGSDVRQWITPQQFNEIMEDTLKRQAFLGLLYQRLSTIKGGPRYAPANMALLATKFMNTIYEVDDLRENLRYKKRLNQRLSFEDYYPLIRTTIDLLNIVLETPPTLGQSLMKRYPTLSKVPAISNEVLSLFENVFAENYSNAIRNVVQLLSITWGLDDDYTAEQRIRKGALDPENLAAGSLATVKQSKAEQQLQRQNQKVKSAILIYGSFMANMVGAQTPAQVKAAIQAVAVPPGSSSVKRKSSFNVALNGYFGAGFHNEILTSNVVPDDQQRSSTFGLSVPIGLTASIGGLGKSESWSYSLFLPIIDVGAITAYRLNQGNTQSDLPELSFSNLIAPGAYVLVNFPKSPFTVGAGAQFGPQARKITINGLEQRSGAWRYGIIATIDVPIFNLFSR